MGAVYTSSWECSVVATEMREGKNPEGPRQLGRAFRSLEHSTKSPPVTSLCLLISLYLHNLAWDCCSFVKIVMFLSKKEDKEDKNGENHEWNQQIYAGKFGDQQILPTLLYQREKEAQR